MPTAIPAAAAAQLPPARMIDPRGHRFGAGVSAVALGLGFAAQQPLVVGLVLLSIGVSAAFGLRYSIYGVIWRRIVAMARLGRVEPEHEYPPRFAQVLGSIALTLALVAFGLGSPPLAWGLSLAVAALQTLLAVTGYCLGCRLYFLRWWVPDVVTRLWTRGRVQRVTFTPEPIRYR
jgi:Zn-dependent protease